MIPELYRIALGYGIHPLTGTASPAGRWKVRNVVTWCRPNPPVGALGDKWRPATSDMVIACTSKDRWFDLDAVRTPGVDNRARGGGKAARNVNPSQGWSENRTEANNNPAGAPPLDYWVIPPGGYSGATTTTRRVSCGPADGGQRTTSPDCPTHGDRLAPAATARCDERGGTSRTRTARTGDHHALALPLGYESTDANHDHSGSAQHPTTATSDPEYSDSASPHSNETSRTGHAPETGAPCMPSAETAPGSTRTSMSPESFEHHHDTSESRTSVDDSTDNREPRTADRIADTDTELVSPSACTCSFYRVITESTSHYAVYPPELCIKPIQAMCPRHVCRTCGQPRRRITERESTGQNTRSSRGMADDPRQVGAVVSTLVPEVARVTTLGWTDCGHNNYRAGLVLDPFAGSGTTLMVANGHGRDAWGIDIDERNLELARERIGPLYFNAGSAA